MDNDDVVVVVVVFVFVVVDIVVVVFVFVVVVVVFGSTFVSKDSGCSECGSCRGLAIMIKGMTLLLLLLFLLLLLLHKIMYWVDHK